MKRCTLQECRAWLPRALMLWIFFMAMIGKGVYHRIEGEKMKSREEILVSRCNHTAVILQIQFNFAVNYARDLAAIIYASGVEKRSSAMDEETVTYHTARKSLERLLIDEVDIISKEIAVKVQDVTNESEPLIIYRNAEKDGDSSLSASSDLEFGDPYRKLRIECRYLSKAQMSFEALKIAFHVFLIGLLSGFIAYHVGMYVIMHMIKVEDDSRKMQELEIRSKATYAAKSQVLVALLDLSTYMNGFLGILDVLVDTELNTSQRGYSRTAQDCGKDLLSVLNSVLDHEKIEAGKMELEEVMLDIRSILDDVLLQFSEKCRSKGVELAVFVSAKVPKTVIGDPERFRQILSNLVGNAIKFTEYGHIFVHVCYAADAKALSASSCESDINFETISAFRVADDRNSWKKFERLLDCDEDISNGEKMTLLVSVEDTGTGVPVHAQRQVFTPFKQADISNSRSYGGIGIGLSVTKCLVELMNGEIRFVTQPNMGSTFSFTAVFTMCENHDDVGRPPMQGFTAIIVDPRPVRATVTKYHLDRLGIRVLIADSVQSAALFGEVDLILVEAEAWLQSESSSIILKKTGSAKFILLAMNIDEDEIERARLAGYSHVVMKPLCAKMMAAHLQQALGSSS